MDVTGYDLHTRALAYARRRLRGLRGAHVVRADMAVFERRAAFDFAYCLLGSFRHLLTDRAALSHLARTRRSLRPGGVYALGLDLCDYRFPEPDEEDWTAECGRESLSDIVETLPPERHRRRERVIHFLTVTRGASRRLYQSEYDLRSYDWEQFRRLLAAAGWTVAETFSPWRKPVACDAGLRDALFLLRAR